MMYISNHRPRYKHIIILSHFTCNLIHTRLATAFGIRIFNVLADSSLVANNKSEEKLRIIENNILE